MMTISRLGNLGDLGNLGNLGNAAFSVAFPHNITSPWLWNALNTSKIVKALPWPQPSTAHLLQSRDPIQLIQQRVENTRSNWQWIQRESNGRVQRCRGHPFCGWKSSCLPDELAEWAKRALAQVSSYSGNVVLDLFRSSRWHFYSKTIIPISMQSVCWVERRW